MRILILGDSHGRLDLVHQASIDAIARWHIEAVIQVGDFGLFPRTLHRFLREGPRHFPVPVHVIDGNHEDHAWLHEVRATSDPTEWAQANLHVHRRGEVISLGGARIGLLGGALHADRAQQSSDHLAYADGEAGPRVPSRPTWANWVTDADVDAAAATFLAAPLDVVVTHSCPAGIGVGMSGAPELIDSVARFIVGAGHASGPFDDCGEGSLTQLWRRLTPHPPLWLFGHFHRLSDRTVAGTRFVCVGSTDDSDGVRGVRPVLFDATTRSLEIHADLRIGQLGEGD